MPTEKNKPATDEMTKAEQKLMDKSFTYGSEKTFKLLDDALDLDLDMWAVASQMFHTSAFVLSQHGYTLDEMIGDCKDAIKQSDEVNEDKAVSDKAIDALHEQGFKPKHEA